MRKVLPGVAVLLLMSGCAINRALNEPAQKDVNVLNVGTPRDLVRAELGQPLPSTAGDSCDLFSFAEGSSGWKYARAVGYGLLDIGTFGLSELAENPVEASVGKKKLTYRVCYDRGQNLVYSESLMVGQPPQLMTGAYPPPPVVKLALPGVR